MYESFLYEIFIFERRPQIPLCQLLEVVEILEVHRIIEVVFGFDVGHDRRRQIAFACERAARCKPHQKKSPLYLPQTLA